MWETVLLEITKNVVVPEIAQYIKHKYESTGEWPTKEELEARMTLLANAIIQHGTEFLQRKVDEV